MQDNIITLAVDVENTGSTTDEDYRRFEETLNKTTYIGEDHSLSTRNLLEMARQKPKPGGNHRGVARSDLKITQDYEVAGIQTDTTLIAPFIININSAVPVGVSAAQAMHMRQRAIAALDHALMAALQENLEI